MENPAHPRRYTNFFHHLSKIKTDSTPPNEPKDPDTSNVFLLYKEFATPDQILEFRNKFHNGISWGDVKQELFQVINAYLELPRRRYHELMASPDQIDEILYEGAKKARAIAAPLLEKIKFKIGRYK